MKRQINAIIAVLFAACMLAACGHDGPEAPTPADADFLDVNVTFSHPQVKPAEGQTLTGCLYYKSPVGKSVASLAADREMAVELTAEQASKGLRMTFENVSRDVDGIWVLLWVDTNASGRLDEGDLAAFHSAVAVADVEEGKAEPMNCIGEYKLTVKLGLVYGEGEFTVPAGYAADYDRNLYTEVTIGPLIWLKENLRTTHYNDGREIPATGVMTEVTTPAYVNPYTSSEDAEIYGYLYNWYVAENGNPCPEGYHVPTDAEFIKTEQFIAPSVKDLGTDASDAPKSNSWRGGDAELGTKMKSAIYYDGTDTHGLALVPGGIYTDSFAQGAADPETKSAAIWTSDAYSSDRGIRRLLRAGQAGSGRGSDVKDKGHSLRCVRVNPDYTEVERTQLPAPQPTAEGTVVSWAEVEHATGYTVSVNGEKIADAEIAKAGGNCSFDVATVRTAQPEDRTYTVAVVALGDDDRYLTSEAGSVDVTIPGTGESVDKEYVKDFDGNEYEVVKIGAQTWMREHLRTTHFSDGTEIPAAEGKDFEAKDSAAYVNPHGKDEAKLKSFGLLYNWFTVATEGKNPCPAGYHIPSDAEFIELETALAPEATDLGGEAPDSNVWRGKDQKLGTMMKADYPSFAGSAESVFAAMPAGTYSNAISKDADSGSAICVLWTTDVSTEKAANAIRRMLQYNQAGSGRGSAKKTAGQSLRCVKDN